MQSLEVVNSRFTLNEDPAVEITFGLDGAEVFWHDNYNDGDPGHFPVCLNVDPIQGCYDVEETISNKAPV